MTEKQRYEMEMRIADIQLEREYARNVRIEIAREIFAEIEKNMVAIDDVDFNRFRAIGARTFAALKKKYMEADEDDSV